MAEEDPGATPMVAEQTLPETTLEAATETPFLISSGNRWSARDAWKCLGMLMVFGIVEDLVFHALNRAMPGFYWWRRSGSGYFFMAILQGVIGLLTTAYFTREKTLKTLWKELGLDCKPSDYVWMGIVCALALQFADYVVVTSGLAPGSGLHSLIAASHAFGFEKALYLLPLLLAPLFEEPVFRGFLYKAFRGSYGIPASTTFIVAWTAWTHWPQYSHSWAAAVFLSLFAILLCYLREKSGSLWDCILCHLAFNGSIFLLSGILR